MNTATSASPDPLIAFVAWNALPAALPEAGNIIGGAETGMWTLACSLNELGIRVAVAVASPRSGIPSDFRGIELWPHVDRFASARRFVSEHLEISSRPRLKRWNSRLLYLVPWLLATKPLRRPDPLPMQPDPRLIRRHPQAWGVFGVTGDTARVVATAEAQRRPSIVFIQSNADLDARLARGESFVSRWGDTAEERRYVLQRATCIVCQTGHQLEMLERRFGRTGELVRNPIDAKAWRRPKSPSDRYVLWIGRYDDFHKRPLLMLSAVEACPSIPFKMVLNPGDRKVEEEIRRRRPANLEIIDCVPFERMPQLFAGAGVFVSTGAPACEGFPNVLLQAAASHTPIVSLEDFDDFVRTAACGVTCGGDAERLPAEIRRYWHCDATEWAAVDALLEDRYSQRGAAERVHDLVRRLTAEQRHAETDAAP